MPADSRGPLLSSDQQNAATRTGQDACVVAGPGSGKTRVLTARFSWLVTEQGIPPGRILAITFTEKAATEIKVRLVQALEGAPALRQQIERAYVSTIHGFCARLLKENAIAAGVDVDFAVLDEPQSQALLAAAADEALDAILAEQRPAMIELMQSLYVSSSSLGRNLDLAKSLIGVYEAIRVAGAGLASLREQPASPPVVSLSEVADAVQRLASLPHEWTTSDRQEKRQMLLEWLTNFRQLPEHPVTPGHFQVLAEFPSRFGRPTPAVREGVALLKESLLPALRANFAGRYFGSVRELLLQAIERMETLYRARKAARAGLDFSDLEERSLELLLDQPAVREWVRQQFDYILMDELQDTNRLQWKILDLIRRPARFFGVGDINQSIYGFRHADPDVFREFRDGLEAQSQVVNRLKENHRSRADILTAVSAIFTGAPGIEEGRLDPKAEFAAKSEPSVEVIVAGGDDTEEADQRETLWIARRIREIQQRLGIPFSSFAVLARKSSALEKVELGLRKFHIPALVIGGRTLMESREVRDAVHFLRVLANTRDEISLAGVLRSPLVGIRDETLLRLKQNGYLWPSIAALDPNTAPLDQPDLGQLLWFRDLVSDLRSRRDAVSPDRLAARIIDESDYEAGLDAQARRNLDRFLSLLRDLHNREPRPLAEMLADFEQLRSAEYLAEAPPAEAANAVRLMTVHAAKGLEFPVVFVAALHQRTPEDKNPLGFLPRYGLGIRWRDPARNEAAEDAAYTAIDAELERRNREEEMRLLYVAMTRAKEHLTLSYAQQRRGRSSPWSKLIAAKLGIHNAEAVDDSSIRSLDGAPVRLLRSTQTPVNDFERSPETLEAPDATLGKPSATDQHDSGVPVTQVGTFIACPRKYYLRHYLGFPDPVPAWDDLDPVEERPAQLAAEVGTQVHQLLGGLSVERPSADVLQLEGVFRSSALAARVEKASRTEREFDFVMELEDLVVRGQIDLWFEEGGESVIVDYKTDQFDPAADPDRLLPYAFQLRLYAIALRKLTGRLPDRALLFFLRSNTVLPVTLDEGSLDTAVATLLEFRDAQDRLEFPLREGEQCWHCPYYRGLCPAGRTTPTYAVQPSSYEAYP